MTTRRKKPARTKQLTVKYTLLLTPEQSQRYRAAAEAAGESMGVPVDLATWIRMVLDREAPP